MNIIEYLKLFSSHTDYEEYVTGGTMVKPNVSYCEDVKDVHYNPWTWADAYFTTVALEGGTITFTPKNSNVISYSIDNGNTWTEGNSVNVVNGVNVIWRGTMTPSTYGIGSFSSTCNFNTQGNVMSLLFGDDFKNQLSLEGKSRCFYGLFSGATKVNSAKNLILPATTLADNCYYSMFGDCTSLTTAPELPATTLAESCYENMFYNCTSLTTAPTILPATTLVSKCYGFMFQNCTNLTSAPELPATTLVSLCYAHMFYGCTKLNYIKAMFTTVPTLTLTQRWVDGVASNGTFVKNSAATWTTTGVNGVPTGWTVETASE